MEGAMSRKRKPIIVETDAELYDLWHKMLVRIGRENDERAVSRLSKSNRRTGKRAKFNVREEPVKRGRGRPKGAKSVPGGKKNSTGNSRRKRTAKNRHV